MKIVGTIVNNGLALVGFVIEDKKVKKPITYKDGVSLITKGSVSNFRINISNEIVGNSNKKLSDLDMYTTEGKKISNIINLINIIKNSNGDLLGVTIKLDSLNSNKKLKITDLAKIYDYFKPANFVLKNRDGKYFITGKNESKQEDFPVLIKSEKSDIEIKSATLNDTLFESLFAKKKMGSYNVYYENLLFTEELVVIPDIIKYNDEYLRIEKIETKYFKEIKAKKIILPKSLKTLGSYSFTKCKNLEEVVLPEGLIEINYDAFSDCDALKELHLPDSLESISFSVFEGCTSLRKINIGKCLKDISNGSAFSKSGIVEITVSPENPYFSVKENVLYNKNMTTLYYYPSEKQDETFEVPTSVTKVSNSVSNKYLKTLIVHHDLEMDLNHFSNLSRLEFGGTTKEWLDSELYQDNISVIPRFEVICTDDVDNGVEINWDTDSNDSIDLDSFKF